MKKYLKLIFTIILSLLIWLIAYASDVHAETQNFEPRIDTSNSLFANKLVINNSNPLLNLDLRGGAMAINIKYTSFQTSNLGPQGCVGSNSTSNRQKLLGGRYVEVEYGSTSGDYHTGVEVYRIDPTGKQTKINTNGKTAKVRHATIIDNGGNIAVSNIYGGADTDVPASEFVSSVSQTHTGHYNGLDTKAPQITKLEFADGGDYVLVDIKATDYYQTYKYYVKTNSGTSQTLSASIMTGVIGFIGCITDNEYETYENIIKYSKENNKYGTRPTQLTYGTDGMGPHVSIWDGYTIPEKISKNHLGKWMHIIPVDGANNHGKPVHKQILFGEITPGTEKTKITKYKTGTSTLLSGVKFGLYNASKGLITTFTTGSDGKVDFASTKQMKPGETYYYKELATLSGYTIDNADYKRITTDYKGNVTFEGGQKVYNTRLSAKAGTESTKIVKYETSTTTPLSGAEFGLYNSSKGLIATLTTGSDGKVDFAVGNRLETGTTYYFRETKAPQGYSIRDSNYKRIVVDANGTVTFPDGRKNTLQ